MSQARDQAVTEETRRQIAEMEARGWYHSIELPDGTVTKGHQSIEQLRKRIEQFPIPQDLRGKRVLDIGAWDGWFSFEMERRGAQVVALDFKPNSKLLLARDLLNSKVEYVVGDICRMSAKQLGHFDIVLFLGVLYHLKHPMLGLENVCELTTDLACIESYVINPDDLTSPPVIEFYEGDELRGQFDNWVGPNVPCLMAMARAAGFASVEFESVLSNRAHVTCRRKWLDAEGPGPQPVLLCVENSSSRDQQFSTTADDYVSFWFKSGQTELNCENVRIEIGPYAARPVNVSSAGGDGWLAVAKLSPGLGPQWHETRLRIAGGRFSNSIRIPVDLSAEEQRLTMPAPASNSLRITMVTDGKTWDRWKVRTGIGACLSLWAEGIPDGCNLNEVRVRLGGVDVPASYVSLTDPDGLKQVNALLPAELVPGKTSLSLLCGDRSSEPVEVELAGAIG